MYSHARIARSCQLQHGVARGGGKAQKCCAKSTDTTSKW